jgi:hypothetical protein
MEIADLAKSFHRDRFVPGSGLIGFALAQFPWSVDGTGEA